MTRPQPYVGAITIGARDPRALAAFYAELLGWSVGTVEKPRPGEPPYAGFARVCAPDNDGQAPALNFEFERHFTRTVWPSQPGQQRSTQHLDLSVGDIDAAVTRALKAGASLATHQPGDRFRVMLDPEGHPFCLCP